MQKDEVFDEQVDSFQNSVAVMPLFARSVAAELREASDQVGRPCLMPVCNRRLCHMLALFNL